MNRATVVDLVAVPAPRLRANGRETRCARSRQPPAHVLGATAIGKRRGLSAGGVHHPLHEAKANGALTDNPEELVCRLSEMAGILRGVRAAGAAEPVLCLLDCEPHHHATFGRTDVCTHRATLVLPAGLWHALLTAALRAVIARASWAGWPAA